MEKTSNAEESHQISEAEAAAKASSCADNYTLFILDHVAVVGIFPLLLSGVSIETQA